MFTTRLINDGIILGRLVDIGHVELMHVLMAASRLGLSSDNYIPRRIDNSCAMDNGSLGTDRVALYVTRH